MNAKDLRASEWEALGANQHKEYWRTGNAGSFRANEVKECSGFEGNRKRRDLTASKRYWMRGNARSFTAKARSFRANKWGNAVGLRGILTRRDMVEEWVPSSISLKTIEWANVKNSEREVNEKGESLNQQTREF